MVEQALTPKEAAERLATTEWWVREQCRRKRVPHLRSGHGRISLLPAHVEALAALMEVQATEERPVPDAALAALGATPRSRAARRRTA